MKTVNVIEAVFFAALDKKDAAERAAYLDQACNGDPDLRRCVEKLLNAQPKVGEFLQAPAAGLPQTVDHAPDERPGTVLGPYKLLHEIGEGGMGTVWMAEQEQPVKRRVALKVIKPGMDSRQVLARFEAERQALALMDHPNIAKVLDAGATDAGRPYFVMELVKGQPITEFCDKNRLPTRERLDLFVSVCHAIQHAHQKGVIHRDIKPTNVLVALYDGKPVPKVIDFGVAKAMVEPLTTKTLFTRHGQVVGTFEYMSPEQATLDQVDIDTRSDVYALGVLMYELLTGTTPLDKERLRQGGLAEVLRLIREEEPPKPSTRLTSTPGLLATAAAYRNSDAQKLPKAVRGELDWIVMKALDKDRNRRFPSASELAMDVGRYLRDEPVQACPPTLGYRVRKYARKNKVAFATGTAVAAALVVGLGLASWQAVRATRAQELAKIDRDAAVAAGKKVEDAFEKLTTLTAARRADQYNVDMATLPVTWEAGNVAETWAMLERHRPVGDEADLRHFEWHYWDRQTHAERVSERLPDAPVQSGYRSASRVTQWTFSGDGSRLGTFTPPLRFGTPDREPARLTIWDAATRKVVRTHTIATNRDEPAANIVSVPSFSHDGKRVALTVRLSAGPRGVPGGTATGPPRTKVLRQVLDVDSGKLLLNTQSEVDAGGFFRFSQLTLSPDGRYCVNETGTAGNDGEREPSFVVLDLEADGKDVAKFEAADFRGFSPHGSRILAVVGRGQEARTCVLETATGKELHRFDTAIALTYSPDGTRLVGTMPVTKPVERQVLKVFDAATGKELSEVPLPAVRSRTTSPPGPSGPFVTPFFSQDGSRLALRRDVLDISPVARSSRTEWIVVDLTKSQILFTPEVANADFVRIGPVGRINTFQAAARFSADGKQLILSNGDNHLSTFDATTGAPLQTLRGHVNPIAAWALAPDGRSLRSVEDDGTFKEWDLNPPEPARIAIWDQAAFRPFSDGAVISADGRFLAANFPRAKDPIVQVWEITGRTVRELRPRPLEAVEGYAGMFGSVALSRDGSRVALFRPYRTVGAQSGAKVEDRKPNLPGDITVWDVASGKELFHVECLFAGHALSADGATVAVRRTTTRPFNDEPGAITIFDVESGREKHSIPNTPVTLQLSFSPDGTRLAGLTRPTGRNSSSSPVPGLAVWTVADGHMLFHVEGEQTSAGIGARFTWSGDGTRILVTSSRIAPAALFTVRNAATGQVESTVNLAARGGALVAGALPVFSPDNRRIAGPVLTRQGRVVKVWDAATGQELLALRAPGEEVSGERRYGAVAFSADGHRLLEFAGKQRSEPVPDGRTRLVNWIDVTTFDATPRTEATRP